MERISHGTGNPDAWVCLCVNTPEEDGFFPCGRGGEHAVPDNRWDGMSYDCDRCGRIIDKKTLRVTGRRLARSRK